MSTKKLQILGSLGSNVEVDSTLTQTGKAADAKAVGDAISNLNTLVGDTSVSDQITEALEGYTGGGESVQSDWDQTDETQPDFIKNKPDEMDALLLVSEMDLTEPALVDADNNVYLDESDNILIL